MALTSSVMGLTTNNIAEAFNTIFEDNKDVYVDIGDGQLHQVETIRRGEVNGKKVVVLRALT
jgi:hypothetical protein